MRNVYKMEVGRAGTATLLTFYPLDTGRPAPTAMGLREAAIRVSAEIADLLDGRVNSVFDEHRKAAQQSLAA